MNQSHEQLEVLGARLAMAWPVQSGETAAVTEQALMAGMNLIRMVNALTEREQRGGGWLARMIKTLAASLHLRRRSERQPPNAANGTDRQGIASVETITVLAENLNSLASGLGDSTVALIIGLGNLLSTMAADLPQAAMAKVVDLEIKLHQLQETARQNPLAALNQIPSAIQDIADLAHLPTKDEDGLRPARLSEVAALLSAEGQAEAPDGLDDMAIDAAFSELSDLVNPTTPTTSPTADRDHSDDDDAAEAEAAEFLPDEDFTVIIEDELPAGAGDHETPTASAAAA